MARNSSGPPAWHSSASLHLDASCLRAFQQTSLVAQNLHAAMLRALQQSVNTGMSTMIDTVAELAACFVRMAENSSRSSCFGIAWLTCICEAGSLLGQPPRKCTPFKSHCIGAGQHVWARRTSLEACVSLQDCCGSCDSQSQTWIAWRHRDCRTLLT